MSLIGTVALIGLAVRTLQLGFLKRKPKPNGDDGRDERGWYS